MSDSDTDSDNFWGSYSSDEDEQEQPAAQKPVATPKAAQKPVAMKQTTNTMVSNILSDMITTVVKDVQDSKAIDIWRKYATTLKQKNGLKNLIKIKEERELWMINKVLSMRKQNMDPEKFQKQLQALQDPNYDKNNDYNVLKYMEEPRKDDDDIKQLIAKNIRQKSMAIKQQKQRLKLTENEKERKAIAGKIIDEMLVLRAEVHILDEALSKKDVNDVLNNKRTQKFSQMFKQNRNTCKDVENNKNELMKCLLEQGMIFATCMYGTSQVSEQNRKIQEICNLLIEGSTNKKALTMWKLGEMLQRSLARIQLKLFTHKDSGEELNADEEKLIELMRDVPILDAVYSEKVKPIASETYQEIFDIVQRLENNIVLTKQEIRNDEDIALQLVDQYNKHRPMKSTITAMTWIVLLFILYLNWSNLFNDALEAVQLEKQDTNKGWFGTKVDNLSVVKKLDKHVYPFLKLGTVAWATYGFTLIIINKRYFGYGLGNPLSWLGEYQYAINENQRRSSIARVYEQTLAGLRNEGTRIAQDGGRQLLSAIMWYVYITQTHDNIAMIEEQAWAQGLSFLLTGAVAGATLALTGDATQTVTATTIASGVSSQALRVQDVYNSTQRYMAYVLANAVTRGLQTVLIETETIDVNVANRLRRGFQTRQVELENLTQSMRNVISGLGQQSRQVVQDLTRVFANSQQLRIQQGAYMAGITCSLCGQRGHRRNSPQCPFNSFYQELKTTANTQNTTVKNVFRDYLNMTDQQKQNYYNQAMVNQGAANALQLAPHVRGFQNMLHEVQGQPINVQEGNEDPIVLQLMKLINPNTSMETIPQCIAVPVVQVHHRNLKY
tara:strand:+ start:9462 stop:11972 length:2511 start_codon:yes stop_codon:yes gene_type:complete